MDTEIKRLLAETGITIEHIKSEVIRLEKLKIKIEQLLSQQR